MNMNTEISSREKGELCPPLIQCCKLLVQRYGDDALVSVFGKNNFLNTAEDKALLEQIIQVTRKAGYKTRVKRLKPDDLAELTSHLPVIVECKDGSYQLLLEMSISGAEDIQHVVLSSPDNGQEQQVNINDFFQQWSGGLLFFDPINTALVCFSIVAREHKIETTQDRLVHEYGLSKREIHPDLLSKMGKDLGMKGKCLTISWEKLCNLNKAFPVILHLDNDRYIIVSG